MSLLRKLIVHSTLVTSSNSPIMKQKHPPVTGGCFFVVSVNLHIRRAGVARMMQKCCEEQDGYSTVHYGREAGNGQIIRDDILAA